MMQKEEIEEEIQQIEREIEDASSSHERRELKKEVIIVN